MGAWLITGGMLVYQINISPTFQPLHYLSDDRIAHKICQIGASDFHSALVEGKLIDVRGPRQVAVGLS